MPFYSILFETPEDEPGQELLEQPACFVDLNLDQVIDTITAGKQDYDLKPFFYSSLKTVRAIGYRHEVMQDLENQSLTESIKAFSQSMRVLREHAGQTEKLFHKYQKQRWFLDAVEIYCQAVQDLAHVFSGMSFTSRGLTAFGDYLSAYVDSEPFTALLSETRKLKEDISQVTYCLLIKGDRVRVRHYASEINYSTEVEKTFEKFKRGAVKDYAVKFPSGPTLNTVEERILDCVAQLHPELFLKLDSYCARHSRYVDETVGKFDREIQFYLAYREYAALFKRAGLEFCYPQVSDRSKEVCGKESFDAALAYKLISEESVVVCNDFFLKGKERIIVVSGPNQGGKTTFARTFGQLHYLACLGVTVPGRAARLFLYDQLFTHFEKEEAIESLRGKLQEDLTRIYQILRQSTSNSIIIINEIFTSTTLTDALYLGKKILGRIIESDSLCVCVTFIDEWASLSEKTVSMVSTVVTENPTLRTFKIVRRPADGLSYALSIAEKYRLSYDRLKERITT